MHTNKTYIAIGSIAGIGVATSVYLNLNRKKRDKLATKLIRELKKVLNPATTGLNEEDAFDIHFKAKIRRGYRGKIMVLTPESAERAAKRIKGAWGFWNDDENAIYAVFRDLKEKVKVSQVAATYQKLYNANLIDVLYDKLSESEINKVLSIVSKFPNYRKA